jgi:hypothetical protein
MLLEEQVAELLRRCEILVGKELSQIRSALKTAHSRSPAVWELLVIEACSHMGALQHEPGENGTLDIQVSPRNDGRAVWVEATYLKPRFLEEERRSRALSAWLYQEARRRGIPLPSISLRLDGRTTPAGTQRDLPELNERQKFLRNREVEQFFDAIDSSPNEPRTCTLSRYTVAITYTPKTHGQWITSSGLALESPKSVKHNALFLKLKNKAQQISQIRRAEPVILCVGSDSSPALSRLRAPGTSSIEEAVRTAFLGSSSLSAVVLVSIRLEIGSFQRRAEIQIITNPRARCPLSDDEIMLLRRMNFNRWKYTRPFVDWEQLGTDPPMAGTLTTRRNTMGEIEVEIPSSIVVEFLAGRTYLAKNYQWDDSVSRALNEGWSVASCSLKDGNIEAAQAPKIVLKLVPPSRVFGPRRDA